MKFFLDALTGKTNADNRTRPGRGLDSLTPGRQVKAMVVSSGSGGKAELSLMGARVRADTELPLRTGQSLDLTVEETSPRLVLALTQAAAKAGGRAQSLPVALQMLLQGRERLLRNLTSLQEFKPAESDFAQSDARELVDKAQSAAAGAVVKPGAGDPGALPKAINATGMNLEASLAKALEEGGLEEAVLAAKGSLKVAVKLLIRELEAGLARSLAEPGRLAELRELHQALTGLSQFLDANQQLNAHLLPERNSLFLSLPFLFGDMLQSGELFFGLPEKDGDGKRHGETSLAFFLTLSGLGQVVIQARLKGVFLNGEIVVENQDKANFLNGLLPELEEALSALGYETAFSVRATPGEDLSQQSPLAEFIRQSGQYLSLTV